MKNGSRLCGTGAARASTPILQNKAYWEVKIQQSGIWSGGVSLLSDCRRNYKATSNAYYIVMKVLSIKAALTRLDIYFGIGWYTRM